jgi:hypothetical protein
MEKQQLEALYDYMLKQNISKQELHNMLQIMPKWIKDNNKTAWKESEVAHDSSDLGQWLMLTDGESL